MPYRRIRDIRYYYEVSGRGEPLLLLHGFTGSVKHWEHHVKLFARHYMTIGIDLLGHGLSDAPADVSCYQMEACAADIVSITETVRAAPVNLLGYSMGGRLALYLALTYPSFISRLILESASPGLKGSAERQERVSSDERLAEMIEREGVESFVKRWEQLPLFASQAQLEPTISHRLRQQRLQNRAIGLANSLRGMGTGIQPSLWSRLPELDRPVLFMAGELDAKFCRLGEQMAAAVPHGTLEIISNSGHTIHLERPQEYYEIVKQFLKDSTTVLG